MRVEQELKLRILDPSAAAWEKITQYPLLALGAISPLPFHALYYDSQEGMLQRAKLAYRVRREGQAWVATLKAEGHSTGGLHQRPEWNVTVSSSEPDLTVFSESEAATRLAPFLETPLQVILETRFERRESRVNGADGGQILVALDRGEMRAQGLRAPILELELELVSGDAATMLEMGAVLCRDLPLLPDDESKMSRGLRLAGLLPSDPHAMRDKIPPLHRRDSAGRVLSHLLIRQSQQALTEAMRHASADTPEHFHQLRKSVRSLRALLHFCRPLDHANRLAGIRQALARWFHAQNIRRDHEVLTAYWETLAQETETEARPLRHWLAAQGARVDAQHGQLAAALLQLWAILLREELQSDQDVQDYVERHLQHQDRKLAAAGDHVKTATDFHALRIRIKNWRYVILALGALWPSKDSKTLLKLLAALQETSGGVHDADMARQHLTGLATSRKHGLAFHAGMLMGYLHARESRQRKKFRKHWKQLESAPRPWG